MSKPEKLRPLYTQADYQREHATTRQAAYRSDFRRDYARILHCPSFRRLQGKTQLFPGIESDFFRNRLTHSLEVAQVAKAIALRLNLELPALSKVELRSDLRKQVEVLKHLTYELIIQSPNLKTVEYRGSRIVTEIFQVLTEQDDGRLLLPDDYRDLISNCEDYNMDQERAICDFIASMTDRYAVEFYGRLKSESAQTIFKPL